MLLDQFPNGYVFDIETTGDIQNFAQLSVTVVGVYSYYQDTYTIFTQETLPELDKLLQMADFLVGFNSDYFDIPILNKYLEVDLTTIPSLDIMREMKNMIGHRISLNSVAGATLNAYKSGSGDHAVKLFEAGLMKELSQYCLDDVKLTKELFDYTLKHKSLYYTSRDGWLRLETALIWDASLFTKNKNYQQKSLL